MAMVEWPENKTNKTDCRGWWGGEGRREERREARQVNRESQVEEREGPEGAVRTGGESADGLSWDVRLTGRDGRSS